MALSDNSVSIDDPQLKTIPKIAIIMGTEGDGLPAEAISAADTLIPFARGGIVPHAAAGYFVPGYNYSSDTTPVLANAGELILNRAAQNNIASQLQEASRGGSNGIARVSGEQIYLAMNAYLRRSGKGELVTWK